MGNSNLQVIASMRPIDKLNWVKSRKEEGRTVLVIGDGINDGPMLAYAHIGVAMGDYGTALAVQSAGVCVMNDDLSKVGTVIEIAKDCKRIVNQNIILSIVFKVLVLVLSLFGYVHL